jgi:WASH complex subunit strumpellin
VNPGEPGDADSIVTLMLKVSQLEYKVKLILQRLLEEKMDRWQALKQQVVERMTELSKFFAQARTAAVRVTQDKKMAEWFSALAREAKSLDGASGYRTIVGRKIQTFVSALEEVEHFDHVDTNLHIKALLADIRTDLLQMVCISAITPDTIHVIEAVSDLSYAWGLLGDYVPIFHERVRGTFDSCPTSSDIPQACVYSRRTSCADRAVRLP